MSLSKVIPFLVAFMMLALTAPLFATSTVAQAENDVVMADASGDVVVVTTVEEAHAATEPTPVPLLEGFKPADLTELRLYDETATEFWIGFTVADFSKPGSFPNQVSYNICFKWDGTGSWYRLWVKLDYPVGGASVEPNIDQPLVGFKEVADATHCNIRTFAGSASLGQMSFTVLDPIIDLEKNTFDLRIPRLEMENMARPNEPRQPVPAKGQTFSGFFAKSTMKTGSEIYHAYDELVGDKTFTFSSDTGNSDLRVVVVEDLRAGSAGVDSAAEVALFGVEVGDFQTVPLRIENHLPEALEVKLEAKVLNAATPGAWQTRIVPTVSLPPATADGPSIEPVTLIVATDATVQHKDRARVLVSAIDERFPDLLGAGLVDVLGVKPPTATDNKLYFHTTGRTCNTADHWLNTLSVDNKARADAVAFGSCDAAGGGGAFEATNAGITFRPDVPFARDYRLSVADTAKGVVNFRAVRVVPGQGTSVPTPTIADINVALYSGGAIIGEVNIPSQQIGSEATPVPFEIPIEAPILGAQAREVLNDRPLAIRIEATKQQRTYKFCDQDVCGFEDERTVPDPTSLAGSLFFVTSGSKIELPIIDSERSGDLINITSSGALVSLRLAGLEPERDRQTNPGKAVVFNYTVRNEGVNRDTAQITYRTNLTGWKVEILPKKNYPLAIAEAATFNVRVTAPDTAREGASVLVTITATSQMDREATASLPVRLSVTLGHIFEDQESDLKAVGEVEKSPGVGFLPLLAVGALLWALRRRRQ